jgi:hypothetical protein
MYLCSLDFLRVVRSTTATITTADFSFVKYPRQPRHFLILTRAVCIPTALDEKKCISVRPTGFAVVAFECGTDEHDHGVAD